MISRREIWNPTGWQRFTQLLRQLLTRPDVRITGAEREICERLLSDDSDQHVAESLASGHVDRGLEIVNAHLFELIC